jgi:transcriptional regulator with GAF, ATPase, and Fis domain
MKINENEFFREATLRICSSLEIEQALWRSFVYIREVLPADRMTLSYYDTAQHAIILYASATAEGGRDIRLKVPLEPEMEAALLDPESFPDILMLNRPAPGSIAQRVLDVLGHPVASQLTLRMRLDGKIQGNVMVIANGRNRYSQCDLDLLKLLSDPFAIALSNSRRYRELSEIRDQLDDDNRYLHQELREMAGGEIVGAGSGLRQTMTMVRQVAPQTSPVLVIGETGSGKELIARAVHDFSPRRDGPFIKVNCGAIPQSLMDSELFGHEKGAFTGATARKRGRFERAGGGTILLDEVGELTPEAQIRLLRVLQEKEIERVGGTMPVKLNIRVVAATHRNLEDMVAAGVFRQDLFYRLNVFPVHIPPLRRRKEDIEPLVRHFLTRKSMEMGRRLAPTLAPGSLEQLKAYDWPGNVRELEHTIERALILNEGELLDFKDFAARAALGPPAVPAPPVSEIKPLDHVMCEHISHALAACQGRVEGKFGAARVLRLKPGTLRHRMKKLGIPFGRNASWNGL